MVSSGRLHGRSGFLVLVGAFVASVLPALEAQSFEGLLRTKRSARGVMVAVHEPGAFKPAATLRVERVVVEREKRGVFRVALLPRLVLEGASFELREPAAASTCIQRLALDLRASEKKRPVEFRRLAMRAPGPAGWFLEAESGEPVNGSAWMLKQVAWRDATGTVFAFSRARLQVDGDGRVVLLDPEGVRPELELASPRTQASPPHDPTVRKFKAQSSKVKAPSSSSSVVLVLEI